MGLERGCSLPWEGESDVPALAALDSTVGRIYHDALSVSCEVLGHHMADHWRKTVSRKEHQSQDTLALGM